MPTLTNSLPFPMQNFTWTSQDDLFRVAIYKPNLVNLNLDDTIAFHIGCYADKTPIAAEYGSDTERQWLDVGSAGNGQYLGKLNTTTALATLPLYVRGLAKNAGLAPVPHKYARCAGEIIGSKVRVYLPPTFSPLAANTNFKVVDSSTVLADFMKSFDKTDEELLNNFREARCALEKRGHKLVIEDDVIKMHISKTINI
jgi:hypothetical protein